MSNIVRLPRRVMVAQRALRAWRQLNHGYLQPFTHFREWVQLKICFQGKGMQQTYWLLGKEGHPYMVSLKQAADTLAKMTYVRPPAANKYRTQPDELVDIESDWFHSFHNWLLTYHYYFVHFTSWYFVIYHIFLNNEQHPSNHFVIYLYLLRHIYHHFCVIQWFFILVLGTIYRVAQM